MPEVRLIQLEPSWITHAHQRIGITFKCPIEDCPIRYIGAYWLPGPGYDPNKYDLWAKTGDSFDTLTLAPSVNATRGKEGKPTGCKFHGHVKRGIVSW